MNEFAIISKAKRTITLFVVALLASACMAATAFADDGALQAGKIGAEKQAVAASQNADQPTPLKAAAKTKTVAKQVFTTNTKTLNKKAVTVKAGKTKLVFKKGEGYIKFVAPKTKKYAFTFSNVKNAGRPGGSFVGMQTRDANSPEYSFLTEVSTQGGSSYFLNLGINGLKDTTGDLLSRYLPSRTGKIKLSKGQAIYMRFNGANDTRHTATLSIK